MTRWRGAREGAGRRWATLAGVVALLVAAPVVVSALPASDEDVPAAELLARVRASAGVPWSGYAEATGRLAVPDVRELGDVADLLGGTTRLRVWWRTAQDWRVDALTVADEEGTYGLGGGTLTWDSGDRRAVVLAGDPPVRLPSGHDLVPGPLARRLLGDLPPDDAVERTAARRVAGVDALGLAVVPADPATTVGRVAVWQHPRTGLPLLVEVTAKGAAAPALRSAVLDLTEGPPSPDLTTFEADDDTVVDPVRIPDIAAAVDRFAPYDLPERLAGLPRRAREDAGSIGAGGVGSYGRGLTVLAVVPLPSDEARSISRRLVAPVAQDVELDGGTGKLVTTSLAALLVVQADRGRDRGGRTYLLAGAVTPDVVARAAQELLDDPPPGRADAS